MRRRWFLLGSLSSGAICRSARAVLLGGGQVTNVQQIVSIAPTSATFVGGSGSAGRAITTFAATLSPASPPFSGTWSIGGTNASSFSINSSTGALSVGGSDVATGNYTITATATPTNIAILPFTQSISLTATTASVPLFPEVIDPDNTENMGAVFYVYVTTPAGSLGYSGGPIAAVVSGSITIDGFFVDNSSGGVNIPAHGQATLQWLLDGTAISGYLVAGGPLGGNGTFSYNTAGAADGTHWLSCNFIDNSGTTPPFLLFVRPQIIVINNTALITGSQTIPLTGIGYNARVLPNQADYVTFPGTSSLPLKNTVHAYPTETIPPANNASSPFYPSSSTLRTATKWYTERITDIGTGEYRGGGRFYTTQNGGVIANEFLPQMGGGSTLELSYPLTVAAVNFDGGRDDNMVSPFTTFVETPDGSGWTGIDTGYTIFTLTHAGVRTTIFGPQANRSVLNYDYDDKGVTQSQRTAQNNFVGQTSGNIGYSGSASFVFNFAGQPSDLCYDPRNSSLLYYCVAAGSAIVKLDLSASPVTATIYAGIHGMSGYVDGPALGGTISTNARFGWPTSIIMDASGNMYVSDSTNNVIRKITSTSTGVAGTVSSLVGTQPGANENAIATTVSIVGGISDGGGVNPGTVLTVTSTSGAILTNYELLTPYVPNNGTLITSQLTGTTGGTGTYRVSSSQFVAAGSNLTASAIGIYSPPGTVAFASANLTYPFTIRFFSDGNIALMEPNTGLVREVNINGSGGQSSNTVRRINYFGSGPTSPVVRHQWMWLDVDSTGTCGPVDDIHFFNFDTWGSAEIQNIASRDGTYLGLANVDGGLLPEGRVATYGSFWDQAHYPWSIAISKTQARKITAGQAVQGVYAWRPIQTVTSGGITADPAFDPLGTGAGLDVATYRRGQTIWNSGTVPEFPYGSRPSFAVLMGQFGIGHLGIGATIDDLMVTYPIPATAGTGSDITFATYLQGGAWGSVARPEITGNDMRDLIYFIRRTSLAGSWPTNPVPATDDPDTGNLPVISSVSATRLSSTSIRVTWTTSKNTLGYAAGGSAGIHGSAAQYSTWSPIETSYGTSHNVVITGLPTSSPTHYAVLSKDNAGNFASSPDATIA